jgi:predicted MFS family arabinose efflux permease
VQQKDNPPASFARPGQAGRPVSTIGGFSGDFWRFLFAENLYDIGLYIFVLLYNLFLLDLGYREDFIGWVTGAATAGTLIGALPAAAVLRRFGLKHSLMAASGGVAVMCLVRALLLGRASIVGAAFVTGLIASVWASSLPPVVAALTNTRNRPLGFSLWTGWGIGLGVVCGTLAGELPGWIMRLGLASTPGSAKQVALALGGSAALFSPLLLATVAVERDPQASPKMLPRGPFVNRFLTASAVWNLAVGSFNPFFTAYFSRHLNIPVSQIGMVFSAAHAAQLGGLLLAPAILKRLGMVPGIAGTQLGVAAALALLAMGPRTVWAAGGLYMAFTAFQFMSEPGTFTLLMTQVETNERAGVSALSFFTTAASQAAAAAVAGMAVTRYGYPVVLATAACVAAVAAFLFWYLLKDAGSGEGIGDQGSGVREDRLTASE